MSEEKPHARGSSFAKIKAVIPKHGFFWEARTRILAWYVALMSVFVVISIPIFYQLVFVQVDRRVRSDLAREIADFQEFLEKQRPNQEGQLEGNIALIFDRFLSLEMPEDDTYFLTFIDGEFYEASGVVPDLIEQDVLLLQSWAKLTQSRQGEKQTSDPQIGNLIYIAQPIAIDGQIEGVFVTVHSTAGEIREAKDAIVTVIEVLVAMLIVAVLLAWVASRQVLLPLRSLARTAVSISETDLTQRIPIRGQGEIAELSTTFNAMMDRLQVAFESQREFVNDAGHELRTPITIIQGHLELLERDDPEFEPTLELVLDELERMTRFVNDLIFLAKAERRDFLEPTSMDLESFTEELYAKAKGLAPRDWQLEGVGKGQFFADRQRITQAVMNLAQNATQHTQMSDTIAIGSARDRGKIRFWVRDTGCGIDPKDRERVFKRFARAAHSHRRSEGAGLGLSIVEAIAHSHGGRVNLKSEVGVGSTFVLIFPLEKASDFASFRT
ncbi:MAG: ATP-binding protein [Cyanobacteriota bacterium]|nr:ATP-binding protein [Cyanobacteriota bacterium]